MSPHRAGTLVVHGVVGQLPAEQLPAESVGGAERIGRIVVGLLDAWGRSYRTART